MARRGVKLVLGCEAGCGWCRTHEESQWWKGEAEAARKQHDGTASEAVVYVAGTSLTGGLLSSFRQIGMRG